MEIKWIEEFYKKGVLASCEDWQLKMIGDEAPAEFFQYRSNDDINIDNLENEVVWASSVFNVNDPFDCDFNTAILDTLGARYSNKEIEMVRESTLDIKRILSISCFSERNDSILMWSHYANKHKGFCACYNLLDILGTHNLFLPVWYRTEKILPLFMGDKLEQNPRIIEIIVQKAPEWSYEREWRLFKYLDIKRLEAGATIKIKPTRIIIGACANEDLKKRLQQIGKDKGIKVTQMTLESGEFKLTEK